MPDVPLAALDLRQQKLVENARKALEQGNADYVIAVCEPLLAEAPGCLPVRGLLRAAQLVRHRAKNPLVAKVGGVLSRAPFFLGGKSTGPEALRAQADKLLASDPTSVTALKLLAGAAAKLDWPETVVFARTAVRELAPADEANLIALGEALLNVGRPAEALAIADGILRRNAVDGPAQNLMRQAAIAQTVNRGNWDGAGDFREKLKPGPDGTGT
ncbi:MAG TPA: hypothetical protein PLF88_03525 [Opitutaceae bacterium]|nr:hypothetical protein [Opitutaceae bacterium]HRJ45838.1 hypothetical protein [Opitutaceae bacterium]